MNKLKIRKFDKSILDHATLITEGNGYFKTYDLNNGNIIKVVKESYECLEENDGNISFKHYDEFINELYGKLLESSRIETPEILLPNSIHMDNDFPKAYTISKLENFVSSEDFLDCQGLDLISLFMQNLSKIVRKANSEGIVLPDIGTPSNIMISQDTGEIKLIDYDGIQIDKFQSFSFSGLLQNEVIDITRFRTFYNEYTKLYKPNIDKLSLYALFLLFTYNPLFADFKRRDFLHKRGKPVPIIKISSIHDYFSNIGLEGTIMENELKELFFSGACNYPEEAIKEVVKKYKLDLIDPNRRFIRR